MSYIDRTRSSFAEAREYVVATTAWTPSAWAMFAFLLVSMIAFALLSVAVAVENK